MVEFRVHRAVSTTIIAVAVVVVVIVVAAGAYFVLGTGGSPNTTSTTSSHTGTSTTTSSSTSSSGSSPPPGSLNSSLIAFVADFNNRDVTSIKTFFTSSSAIAWTGSAGGLQGTYQGQDGAGIVYGTSVGHTTSLSAIASNEHIAVAGSTGTVGFHIDIKGVSTVIGKFNTSADISQVWVYQSGAWTIQTDDWNYVSFQSNNPGQATVFPQWGLMLNGQPPSLANEHVLEWNVAPYLAAGVYATIVLIGLALIWVRIRKQKQ